MKPTNSDRNAIVEFAAFFTLAIIALLIVIKNFFPIIGIEMKGTFINVLETLQSVLMLVTLGIAGFSFVNGKKKGWKIAYWIIIGIFVVATVLVWFK